MSKACRIFWRLVSAKVIRCTNCKFLSSVHVIFSWSSVICNALSSMWLSCSLVKHKLWISFFSNFEHESFVFRWSIYYKLCLWFHSIIVTIYHCCLLPHHLHCWLLIIHISNSKANLRLWFPQFSHFILSIYTLFLILSIFHSTPETSILCCKVHSLFAVIFIFLPPDIDTYH